MHLLALFYSASSKTSIYYYYFSFPISCSEAALSFSFPLYYLVFTLERLVLPWQQNLGQNGL